MKNIKIPTETIKQDIKDTEKEIKDLFDELNVLSRNRIQNRVRIYFLEGKMKSRVDFVKELKEILSDRETEVDFECDECNRKLTKEEWDKIFDNKEGWWVCNICRKREEG